MNGLHCVADVSGCTPVRLSQHHELIAVCEQSVRDAGLTVVAKLVHAFDPHPAHLNVPAGMTCTLLLAESHVCVHTWPEMGAATLDVYVCNLYGDNDAKARQVLNDIVDWLQPQVVQQQEIRRGQLKPLCQRNT